MKIKNYPFLIWNDFFLLEDRRFHSQDLSVMSEKVFFSYFKKKFNWYRMISTLSRILIKMYLHTQKVEN